MSFYIKHFFLLFSWLFLTHHVCALYLFAYNVASTVVRNISCSRRESQQSNVVVSQSITQSHDDKAHISLTFSLSHFECQDLSTREKKTAHDNVTKSLSIVCQQAKKKTHEENAENKHKFLFRWRAALRSLQRVWILSTFLSLISRSLTQKKTFSTNSLANAIARSRDASINCSLNPAYLSAHVELFVVRQCWRREALRKKRPAKWDYLFITIIIGALIHVYVPPTLTFRAEWERSLPTTLHCQPYNKRV